MQRVGMCTKAIKRSKNLVWYYVILNGERVIFFMEYAFYDEKIYNHNINLNCATSIIFFIKTSFLITSKSKIK